PSGGFYTSAADLAKFVQFQLNDGSIGGRRLIPASLLEEMRAIQFPVSGQIDGYGLGLGRYHRYGGVYYNHHGGGFGVQSHISWYPQLRVRLVLLTHSTDHDLTGRFSYEVIDRVLRATLGRVPQSPVPAITGEIGAVATATGAGRALLGTYFGRSSIPVKITTRGDTVGLERGDRFDVLR